MPLHAPKSRFLIVPLLVIQLSVYFLGNARFLGVSSILAVVLFLWLVFSGTKLKGRFHKRIFAGLTVTLLGMVYFYFVQARYTAVLSSLLFFVLPQICFINAFYLDFKSAPELDKRGARVAIGVAFAFSLLYYLLVREALGILKLPVMIGVFTTSFMFMMASFRNQRVNPESFRLVLAGVICYMLGEGAFAYHRFAKVLPGMDLFYAMISTSALYLIVLGTISRKLNVTT